jgi:hypothetical protein
MPSRLIIIFVIFVLILGISWTNNAFGQTTTVIDDLNNLSKTNSHTGTFWFDGSSSSYFQGDTSRLARTEASTSPPASVVYKYSSIQSFTVTTFFWPGESISHFTFLHSSDGATWTSIAPEISNEGGNWIKVVYSGLLPAGANFLKVQFPSGGTYWTPQVSQVMLTIALGWQPEQVLAVTAFPDGNSGSCAKLPGTQRIMCVYNKCTDNNCTNNDCLNVTARIDLYMILSEDGGVTWGEPSRMTSNAGDEYDPFLVADEARGRVWILYSKWHNNACGANDLVLSWTTATDPSVWTSPTCVQCDGNGMSHWDASLVALTNGDLLALESFDNGDNTSLNDKVRALRSTDAGQTWSTPQAIYDGPGDEQFPVGVQQPDGSVVVAFRSTLINPTWGNTWAIYLTRSLDNGSTWQPPSLFYDTPSSDLLTFIGKQTASNLTILGASDLGGIWRLYVWQSGDGGNTWDGPYQISDSPYSDGGNFVVGCLGPIFTYGTSGGSNWVAKRYNWTPTCQ